MWSNCLPSSPLSIERLRAIGRKESPIEPPPTSHSPAFAEARKCARCMLTSWNRLLLSVLLFACGSAVCVSCGLRARAPPPLRVPEQSKMSAPVPSARKVVKKTISAEDGRKNRLASAVQLRKEKRDEGIAKKRNANASAAETTTVSDETAPEIVRVEDLPRFAAGERERGVRDGTASATSAPHPPASLQLPSRRMPRSSSRASSPCASCSRSRTTPPSTP